METLPATGQQLREFLNELRLVIFALAVVSGMTLILSFNLAWTRQVTMVAGQPAPADAFAPRSVNYTSEILTQQSRDQARRSVSDRFTPLDLSIGREQLAQASSVFAFIETVRADVDASQDEKIRYVQSIEDLEVDEAVAADLLAMSQADFEAVRAETQSIIDNLMREEIRESELEDFQRAARRQVSLGLKPAQSNAVTNLVWQFIEPTIFPDEEATAAAREDAATQVEPVTRSVAEGQRIVRAGEIVAEADIELMGQLGLLRQSLEWPVVASAFLVAVLAVTIILLYWRSFRYGMREDSRHLTVLGGMILLFTLAAKLMSSTPGNWPLLFPLAMLSMLLAVVFEARFAILITVLMAGVFGFAASSSLQLALFAGAGALVALLTLRDAQRIVAYFRSGLLAAGAQILVLLVFALPLRPEPLPVLTQMIYALGNGLLSAALTLVGFFVLGSVFGIITTLQLQDLSRLDHPLLQELLRRAPGTYHHSIMVANLAEQAAERVRANSTLVRVGSFYHDIGKMNRPPFFTENQEGINPHDTLDPYTSARIIISHVTEGLALARRYRLPDRIKDFVAEHHGLRTVKGFYLKALSQAGGDESLVDKDRFVYPGPRPRSRETGIVMLADAIEATSSALRPDSSAAIEKLVNSIVDEDVMKGQLNNSGLSLGDIERIRASFIETLKGRFHVRVKYPGNEELEAPPERPALPEPEPNLVEAPEQAAASPILSRDLTRT